MNIAFGGETITLYILIHTTCVQDKYLTNSRFIVLMNKQLMKSTGQPLDISYMLVNITSDQLNFMKKTGGDNILITIIFIILKLFCSVVKMTCQENYIYQRCCHLFLNKFIPLNCICLLKEKKRLLYLFFYFNLGKSRG